MTLAAPPFRLLLVTDPSIPDPCAAADAALAALPPGGAAVQVRDRTATGRALLDRARALREVASRRGAALLVNDRADVAIAAGADGVHLPAASLAPADARALGLRLVGRSAHAPAEAREAARAGCDYVVFGPVFPTRSHPDRAPLGPDALAEACRAAAPVPVLAIGGLHAHNARIALAAGARGLACIRAVLAAADPAAAARMLWDVISAP